MRKEQFSIGKKQLKVPIIQGGMGVGISLGGLAGAVAKKVEPERYLLRRLVFANRIFMRIQ